MNTPTETTPEKKAPWYFKSGSLVIAFLCVGPLMLPLLWMHPKMSKSSKLMLTVVIGVLSYFLVMWTMESFKKISASYQELLGVLPQSS